MKERKIFLVKYLPVFEESLLCSTDDEMEKTIYVSMTGPDYPSVESQ